MPSGVKPNLDYILNFGQWHGDLITLISAISDHAVNKDQVTEPEITSSPLQALINYWGCVVINGTKKMKRAKKCENPWSLGSDPIWED
jgi:hypothetical protein